jgi:hypothetical protein
MKHKPWKIKHQGIWYPLIGIVDSGKPAHEEGGGNHYHVEGHDPIHQKDVEDISMDGGADMGKVDKIPGGLAAGKKPSDFDPKKLQAGIKVEMEHTSDEAIAREIAMDHLTEDSEYYVKLKDIEKYDRIDVTADGKREFDVGAEPLDKKPDAVSRWKKLKKALDSSTAIMDLSSAEGDDEDQEEAVEPSEEKASAEEPQDEGAISSEQAGDQGSQSDQEVIDLLREEGYDDSEIAYIIHNHSIPIPTKDDHAAQNEAAKGETKLAQMQEAHEMQQGHAHETHQQERQHTEDEHKHNLEHKKRMADVEYDRAKADLVDPKLANEHKRRMLDVEYEIAAKKKELTALEGEHKKRMLDLEYHKAHKDASKEDPTDSMKKEQMAFEMQMKRMEKELELEFKKKELALKLKLTEESARQKAEHQAHQTEEDAKVNSAIKKEQAKHKIAEAKKPPQKEKE